MTRSITAGLVSFVLVLGAHSSVHGAVYQCTSPTGAILLTDGGCPSGYTTDLVVADHCEASTSGPCSGLAPPPANASASAQRGPDEQNTEAVAASAALLQAETENARLRSELTERWLRTIDNKLDALLEAPQVYGGVGVVPIRTARECKKGRNCAARSHHIKPKASLRDASSCGIAGCTPGILSAPWDYRLDRLAR